jgi:hypothetical protein
MKRNLLKLILKVLSDLSNLNRGALLELQLKLELLIVLLIHLGFQGIHLS